MKREIVLIGGGGHCKVIVDAIKKSGEFSIYGIVDQNLPQDALVSGIKVVGNDGILSNLFKQGVRDAFVSVGSIGDCSIRKCIFDNLKKIGFNLSVIVHPGAIVAENVELGEGTFVAAGVVIGPEVKIGKNSIINTSCSVDHDCKIGDFVHIAPGVTLSGGVTVGDDSHLGTGAQITQSINIGKGCLIGAGTTVRYDISDGSKNFGPVVVKQNAKE